MSSESGSPPLDSLAFDGLAYLDDLYSAYGRDPQAVPAAWAAWFAALDTAPASLAALPITASLEGLAEAVPFAGGVGAPDPRKQVAVLQLINAYRFRGHRRADLDPLHQGERPVVEELDPAFHGLTDADLPLPFRTGSLCGPAEATLAEILERVRNTYCRTVGVEYMHIVETAEKRWIQQRLEPISGTPTLSAPRRREVLGRVTAAAGLEEYLHTKYVGQKRFSLEGGESLIPLLDEFLLACGEGHVPELVIGMAHRGRLNVLLNTVGKPPHELFQEFEGKGQQQHTGSGDVKYHLGYSNDLLVAGGALHVTLAFNPSHLEIIGPVVEGSVRARQERRGARARDEVLPLILHGDASFAGQGVVAETLNLSQTRGYATGGTLHVVVNNQIGFTTSDPLDSRSTLYCTDVAKMVQAPIFHVNGDDPEAVVMVARLAFDFRMTFHKDVVIDLVCYRRHGHNETDEPAATQPLMYRAVKAHAGVRQLYAERLEAEGILAAGEAQAMAADYVRALEENRPCSRPPAGARERGFQADFSPYRDPALWGRGHPTGVPLARLGQLSERLTALPAGFVTHPAVDKVIAARRAMGRGEQDLDWGAAETLAYASLVTEGFAIRLSGQDSERGTFFHRHAVLHHQETGEKYTPLTQVSPDQAPFRVINSILSEEAVLAFEYGYSSAEPGSLVIWEAQFGDFANNAQVVIDQFIASCEAKWGRFCGLTLLLPHGYDGQGPEHSSARIERYLELCADNNMQICIPSTPAQIFHLLRRQMLRPERKPLVVMTPKSLLRHKFATSPLAELATGGFRNVIPEQEPVDPARITRVLACAGKVYYDLREARRAHGIEDTALLRIEQLYPFPKKEVQEALAAYPRIQELVWVQEEPRNQGGWGVLLSTRHLGGVLAADKPLRCEARPYSASPAVGYASLHQAQQQDLVARALKLKERAAATGAQQRSA
jgi:2-oxoglutarate dehydrogenase E1 component